MAIEVITERSTSAVALTNERHPIRELTLETSEGGLDNVSLCISYLPEQLHLPMQRYWISHMNAGERRSIRPHCPGGDLRRLRGITQRTPGRIRAELLMEDGSILSAQECDIDWLPNFEFPGIRDFPEWAATFIDPDDAAVDKIVKRVHPQPEGGDWPGYREGPLAVLGRVQALWKTLRDYNVAFSLPRPTEEKPVRVGIRAHTPSEVLEQGYAQALDVALTLCSCAAHMNLNPVFIISGARAYVGVLQGKNPLPTATDCDAETLGRMQERDELVAMEASALLTDLGFESARVEDISEIAGKDDFLAVDVRQLWEKEKLSNAHGRTPARNSSGDAVDTDAESLVSTTPKSRLDHWQRKLLDLSLRNALLNAKLRGKNRLPIIVPDPARLEDALAKSASYRVKSLPEDLVGNPDRAEGDGIRDAMLKAAERMMEAGQIATDSTEENLRTQLGGLYNATRREMEESGVNTLYIACGFLRWIPKDGSKDRLLRAPLILVPVQLARVSVRDGYTLRGTGDDPQINKTLLELLRTEYSVRLPELEGELPRDEKGVDVARILQIMRNAVTGMEGWGVEEQCMLGLFSFTKFLMWQDMVARKDELLKNAVVRHLAATDRGRFPEQVGFPNPDELDSDEDADKIYTPLSSDSSQLAAVLAAARGKSFVLEGPPGTGKSQTIANMIAHCLGSGKTVLFVAEKAVALEVVHKRLAKVGLGDYCLQLHSNKTRLESVMEQLRPAIANMAIQHDPGKTWEDRVDNMTRTRDVLNGLPRAMHTVYADGETLYEAVCRIAQHRELPTAKLTQEDPLTLTHEQRRSVIETARNLATHFSLIRGEAQKAAQYLHTPVYTGDWETELADELNAVRLTLQAREDILKEWTEAAEDTELDGVCHAVAATALEMMSEHPRENWSVLLPQSAKQTVNSMQQMVQHAEQYRALRAKLSLRYKDGVENDAELDTWLSVCREAADRNIFTRWFSLRRCKKYLQRLAAEGGSPTILQDLLTLVSMRTERLAIEQTDNQDLPSFLNPGVEATQEDVQRTLRLISCLADCDENQSRIARRYIDRAADLMQQPAVAHAVAQWKINTRELMSRGNRLSELLCTTCPLEDCFADGSAEARIETLLNTRSHWRNITLWNKQAEQVRNSESSALVDMLLSDACPPEQLEKAAEVNLGRYKLRAAAESLDALYNFAPALHEEQIRNFGRWDTELRNCTGRHVSSLLSARAGHILQFDKQVALLQKELTKRRAHMPLRKLLQETSDIIPLLKPCFLMSPLSIAQYLTPSSKPFDVVIFDEASQIPVWDAIGAIGRGTSLIVTGDSRQMPPTSFFSRSKTDEENEEEVEQDMESILDECIACGVPRMCLTWHYRSKSEALIAFSNAHYYEGKMTTFPAPTLHDTALQFHLVKGVYEPGAKRRINEKEAKAVVEHVLQTLRTPGFRYTEATSIGVVTFNMQQQKLIDSLFEEARAEDPSLEPYFAEDNSEAVFVKNLENVQGDERGVIYFSTTYARDAEGRMSMNFGPLNLAGGERRLNVAVTRARYAMHVFSSMQPEDIDLSRTHAQGAEDLRAFLEYARNNSRQSASAPDIQQQDPLARHIAASLSELGWKCRTNIGTSDYRVDIAVEDPENENTALAGIALDGPRYGAAHTARDRDVTRPGAMALLGWRMINVWALDWWRHPQECIHAIDMKLREYQKLGPVKLAKLPSLLADAHPAEQDGPEEEDVPTGMGTLPGPEPAVYVPPKKLKNAFEMKDEMLKKETEAIIRAEAPLTLDLLAQRLVEIAPPATSAKSRRYAGQFASFRDANVQQAVRKLASENVCVVRKVDAVGTEDSAQEIISLPNGPEMLPRAAGTRKLQYIPADELREIARLMQRQLACLPGSEVHIRAMAKFLALPRLSKDARLFLQSIVGVTRTES